VIELVFLAAQRHPRSPAISVSFPAVFIALRDEANPI
jgi:hypothetical protein